MRITNSMMVNRMMMNMNRNLNKMNSLYDDYSTGKKIHRPSDNPILVARSLKISTDISENEQFKKNINDVNSVLEKTETSLNELNSVLLRVRELTSQASNGVLTKKDTLKIKAEVDQLKEEIIKISNDTYVGRHIYSGYKTDKPYMSENGIYNMNMNKHIKTENLKFPLEIKSPNNTFEMDIAGLKDEDGVKYTGKYKVELEAKTYSNMEEIQEELQNKLNSSMGTKGVESVQVSSPLDPTKKGDNKLTEESVTITFDKELDASSKDIIQSKLNKEFGAGNATVVIHPTDSKKIIITANSGKELDLAGGKDILFKAHELKFNDGSNNLESIGIRLSDNNDYFKANIDNNKLVIENDDMKDDQKFALKLDVKELRDQLGLEKLNISESSEKIKYQVGVSADLEINITGDRVFGAVFDTDDDGIGDKTIMDTMNDLINHLESGDTEKISKILDEIDGHRDNVSMLKGEIGAKTNTAETIKNRIEQTDVNFKKLLSETEDTDMAKVSMEFMTIQSIYQASLNIGAKIIQPTLVDFVR
jgi:flagellar hook-associated protein 3 FlgL